MSVDINLLFNAINILLLYMLVRKFLLKPVQKILQERQSLVESSLNEAQQAKEQALEMKLLHENSMRGVEQEKLALMKQAQKKATQEYGLIVKQAKQQAEVILQKAQDEAEGKKTELLRQTKHEISEIIVEATQKVLSGADNAGTLYDEFLKRAGGNDATIGS